MHDIGGPHRDGHIGARAANSLDGKHLAMNIAAGFPNGAELIQRIKFLPRPIDPKAAISGTMDIFTQADCRCAVATDRPRGRLLAVARRGRQMEPTVFWQARAGSPRLYGHVLHTNLII
ncbi:MAG TPA: hypothetical protein VJK90_01735 [Acetobacteraceae bacterium]|jgi:hypothetical protein|nr:hypothetical protein [Acetobacteraceae bacterium]